MHGAAAVEIGFHAAHEVVCRGQNGDEIAGKIEAVAGKEGADAGEALIEINAGDVVYVEEDGLACAGFA